MAGVLQQTHEHGIMQAKTIQLPQMVLDGYSDLVKIGEGGMAVIYRGIQDSLQRPVAIKVLIQQLSDHEEARRRFERESYIIARLNHPNIIHVIDRGITADAMPYFVMEYIEGIDLSTAVKSENLVYIRKIDIIIQTLKALSYAHKNNVIHRDIKPDNIILDNENHIKVLDFGIAQFYDENDEPGDRTTFGTIMGTYNYMSPEQRDSADNVTERSDLFSIGVIMYELFTDKLPLGRFPAPSELNSSLSKELNEIILSCLETDPEKRPASAEELKNSLLSLTRGAHLGEEQKKRANLGVTKIQSKFLLLDVIKENKFGAVYLYQQKQNGSLLVIKKQTNESAGYEENAILASLEHINIVSTLGTSKNERFYILVQEYLSGGNLQDKLAGQLDWEETLNIAREICAGILFAHNNRVHHGNLRPSNILFNDSGQVKINDFAIQGDTKNDDYAHYYRLKNEVVSEAMDIYSVGVILYQLFTGCLPKRHSDDRFIVRRFFTKLPAEIQELIKNMISTIPGRRKKDSLGSAMRIFDALLDKHSKTLVEKKTVLVPKPKKAQKKKSSPVMLLLFLLLLVLFFEYLVFFSNPDFITDIMASFYKDLFDSLGL